MSNPEVKPDHGIDPRIPAHLRERYGEWHRERLWHHLSTTFAIAAALMLVFWVRDAVLTPSLMVPLGAVRAIAAISALIAVAAIQGQQWQRTRRASMRALFVLQAAVLAVIWISPHGPRYSMTSAMLIPLVATMFVPRRRELLWLQALTLLGVGGSLVMHDTSPQDAISYASVLLLATAVTTVVGTVNIDGRLHQFLLQVKLQDEAHRDALTGLYNRRRLDEVGDIECARALRHTRPLSVLVIDLDSFKRVNDVYGHAVGDRVIAATAAKLSSLLRKTDLIARIGGEEFAVLLPETPARCALILAERLRQAISELRVETATGTVRWTASIGVDAHRVGEGDLAGAFHRADVAMYDAKGSGRNQVKSHLTDVDANVTCDREAERPAADAHDDDALHALSARPVGSA